MSFDYNLVLTFATVSGPQSSGSDSSVFDMKLSGNDLPGSNGSVTISGFDAASLGSITLRGLPLSDFRFVGIGSGGSFSDGTWTVAQGAKLLLADVADHPLHSVA